MAELVVGPLLRHVDRHTATIWVETDVPCAVSVQDATVPTFTVHGHHYGLVEVGDLSPGESIPYTVSLDGDAVWPTAESTFPPSRIRTVDPERPVRLVFGSCRRTQPHDTAANRAFGVDALRAYALRMSALDEDEWPTALLMLGDQVYADETPPAMREIIRSRRDPARPPGFEVADFEEYTQLYRLSWRDPATRWLLSTIPTFMVFDDHDVHDDWNTSLTWREQMARLPWWHDRIVGALGSYWLYQHIGNLSPKERANDPLFAALKEADGDGGRLLDTFASRAHSEPESRRWSYALDLGRTRLLVVDSRAGRTLGPRRRAMLDDEERAWVDDRLRGDVDHLLVATSLPYLLPSGIHHVEAWNEAVSSGRWGPRSARLGERVRQALDLEHWGAFEGSFRDMARSAAEVATGRRGTAPADVTFLSGDVHYSYLVSVDAPPWASPVHQVVCSPIRNPLPTRMRWANRRGFHPFGRLAGRALARAAGVPPAPLSWRGTAGPWFDNALATVRADGRSASVRWEAPRADESGRTRMVPLGEQRLTR
ncbi:MAG: alkaline phosphatase D family protein [Streptosporangiaceae bacterium]